MGLLKSNLPALMLNKIISVEGTITLTIKFNIPVVPVYIERIKDLNFKISINNPINFTKEDSIENITLKLNQILEKMILKKPEQWIWSHNRWK